MENKKRDLKSALYLGTLCTIVYFIVYVARNILSTVTPQMIENTSFTEIYIGKLSSLYFIFYALGQLINGILGDKIKAKYMLSIGLLLAGITNLLICYLTDLPNIALIVYPLTGFFLAMIYAPMVKVISENTNVVYAERCSLGYSFSSYFGSPAAGMLASFLPWYGVFKTGSILLFAMAIICFACFIYAERNDIVRYSNRETTKTEKKKGAINVLLKRNIIKFTLISILTGVVRTTVVFWMPTYFMQNLGYSSEQSATLFTITTIIICPASFVAIFAYQKLKRNVNNTSLLMFLLSAVCFLLMFFTQSLPILNIICMGIAIMAANGASAMIWSVYCPSLHDTGLVSSATGFLDFVSYGSASISSTLFANAVTVIGWNNLIVIWATLMFFGVLTVFPYKKIFTFKKQKTA